MDTGGRFARVGLAGMSERHLPDILSIERESFNLPWTENMFLAELGNPDGWTRVAVASSGRAVGYAVCRELAGAWHIMDLAVHSHWRGSGVAGALLDEFLERMGGRSDCVLEVRVGNSAARRLYESRGFCKRGCRPGYYRDTGEDALVMVRGRDTKAGGILLAIETSCDDTCAAVLDGEGGVLSSVRHSQDEVHARYGGVVPEVASRAHVERASGVIKEALVQADAGMGDLSRVAVTVGPGLIGALLVGVQMAKGLAWSRKLPLTPVNHLHGHLASAWLADPDLSFPAVVLLASGGHTMLVRMRGKTDFQLLGETRDDAVGEAFDKGARLLSLGYPGGKQLDELAARGRANSFSLPVGLEGDNTLDFSFSGVKTALYYLLRDLSEEERRERAPDVAAAYREALVRPLVQRLRTAAERESVSSVAVVGGVAANSLLRRRVAELGEELGVHTALPPLRYCTDNAAMIGAAGLCGTVLEPGEYEDLQPVASLRVEAVPGVDDELH